MLRFLLTINLFLFAQVFASEPREYDDDDRECHATGSCSSSNDLFSVGHCEYNGEECVPIQGFNDQCQLVHTIVRTVLICMDPSQVNKWFPEFGAEAFIRRTRLHQDNACMMSEENELIDDICRYGNGTCVTHPQTDWLCETADQKEKRRLDELLKSERAHREEALKDNLLIAIDGTGSYEYFDEKDGQKPRFESNNDRGWIWSSHVSNFYEDYGGTAHYYYGPDASLRVMQADQQVKKIANDAHKVVCNYIRARPYFTRKMLHENTDSPNIDMIGYSRGCYGVMHLARLLQIEGCEIEGEQVAPIHVRFMGLYDPVKSTYEKEQEYNYDVYEIAPTVAYYGVAAQDDSIHSRPYFDFTYDQVEYNSNDIDRFKCSHSGMGGMPGEGDSADFWTFWVNSPIDQEKKDSGKVDQWIRRHAVASGVSISETGDGYYGDFVHCNPCN